MFDFLKRLLGSKEVVVEPKELEAAARPALPRAAARSEAPPPPPPPPPPPKRVAERISESGTSIEVDFVAVLDEGAIGEIDRDRINRAQSLLQTLPADAPAGLKRRIVEAAFSVFDVPTSKIIEASSSAIDVVGKYVAKSQEATEKSLARSEEHIAQLEASIRDERLAMERAREIQRQREALAAAEVATIEPIVRFFTAVATIPPPSPDAPRPLAPSGASFAPKPPLPSLVPNRSSRPDEEVTAIGDTRASIPPAEGDIRPS